MRSTHNEFPRSDATPAELRQALLKVAAELRLLRIGNQPDRIERIVELLEAPQLEGVLAQVGHPNTWVNPEGSKWLAEQLMVAAGLIAELLPDAEICGSSRILERAREWLEEMGLLEAP